MKKMIESEIALICYACVSSNFAIFCNPKNQGCNFKWENFVNMQKNKMKTQIWLQMSIPEKQADKIAKCIHRIFRSCGNPEKFPMTGKGET